MQSIVPDMQHWTLPDRYLITGKADNLDHFMVKLEKALQSGIRLIQYRAPDLDQDTYVDRAFQIVEQSHKSGARVLLNGDPAWVGQIGADGVHLNGHRLKELSTRPLEDNLLISASCHNEEELQQAAAIGVDFAVLSAVLPTQTHPDRSPLGWERFAQLVKGAPFPVYALGGVNQDHIRQSALMGGQGVAAITAFWG